MRLYQVEIIGWGSPLDKFIVKLQTLLPARYHRPGNIGFCRRDKAASLQCFMLLILLMMFMLLILIILFIQLMLLIQFHSTHTAHTTHTTHHSYCSHCLNCSYWTSWNISHFDPMSFLQSYIDESWSISHVDSVIYSLFTIQSNIS